MLYQPSWANPLVRFFLERVMHLPKELAGALSV